MFCRSSSSRCGSLLAVVTLLPSLAQGEDASATAAPAAPASPAGGTAADGPALSQLQQRLDGLQQQVDALQQQARSGSGGASLDDRVWRLEADQLTDTQVSLGGSGGVTLTAARQAGRTLDANASPMLLLAYQNDLLFVGEFNCDQADGVSLGQAWVAYTALPHLIIEAGLFPLPFAAYSERFSPQWINREATVAPMPYADGYGVFAGDQSDTGLQVRGDVDLGDNMRANYHLFLSEGPTYNDPDNGTPDDRLAFGSTPTDHVPPTVGGRIGWLPAPGTEIGLSAMAGSIHNNATFDPTIDPTARRSFAADAIDAQHRIHGILFLGEWVVAHYQDAEGLHHRAQGAYLEASRLWRLGEKDRFDLEPVLRLGGVRRDANEAGYRNVDEIDAGINAYIGWHLRVSLNGQYHSQHALDQATCSAIVPF